MLAAPAVDAATGEYAGWISVGSLLEQILTTMYPALLDPEFVSQAGEVSSSTCFCLFFFFHRAFIIALFSS